MVTIQAVCECPASNEKKSDIKSSSTLLLNIPIQTISDSKVDAIYTPIDLEPKSSALTLKAPQLVQLGNNSLRFAGWTGTDQENQVDSILSLRIYDDTMATANYKLK
jgi:hypothetical protein